MKTVSLKVAKKLQDNGIVVESEFVWYRTAIGSRYKLRPSIIKKAAYDIYPAPTLDELLDMLPEEIYVDKRRYRKALYSGVICYEDPSHILFDLVNFGILGEVNSVDAAAHLLIWCKVNGYLKEVKV